MPEDQRIAPNFWLSEVLASDTAARRGISNTPGPAALRNILQALGPGLQRVRDRLGVPLLISSGYRSQALNAAIGGARNSQHMEGLAADFTAPSFGRPIDIVRFLAGSTGVGFDQLIQEGAWVHVSFAATGQPRGEVMTAHFGPGGTTYTVGA